ncbi:MAG: hypothetical protein WDN48_07970 [Pseudolabrys sp.]
MTIAASTPAATAPAAAAFRRIGAIAVGRSAFVARREANFFRRPGVMIFVRNRMFGDGVAG